MAQKLAVRSRVRSWASPSNGWKILCVNPAVNGYLFELGKDKAAKGGGMGSAFHLLCPSMCNLFVHLKNRYSAR